MPLPWLGMINEEEISKMQFDDEIVENCQEEEGN
jgi:hypothetical protein